MSEETLGRLDPGYIAPIRTRNHRVACEPIATMSVEKEQKGGMMVPKQKGSLTKLRVLFEGFNLDYPKGSVIWIRADQFIQQWAKDVLELDGVKFILVPEDQIVMSQSV